MACNARVASAGASLGLPELQLGAPSARLRCLLPTHPPPRGHRPGIIPGFGGTARLPRLVGLEKALNMMLKSKPVKARATPLGARSTLTRDLAHAQAEEALKSGLVDAVVPTPGDVLPAAKALALDISRGAKPKVQSLKKTDKLPNMMVLNFALAAAREGAAPASRFMAHPGACIDAIEAGLVHGGPAGLKAEAAAFAACVHSPAARALVHFFFAQRATASLPGTTDVGLSPKRIQRVGVLGGGLMGAGIAAACLVAGLDVTLKEVNQTFLDAGMGRVKANVESVAKKRKLPAEAVAAMLARCSGTLEYAPFRELDMVIEAVLEDLGLKQRIFADLEAACSFTCILSTNTSTIDITQVAARCSRPDRVLGAHFFSPAHVMQLFEIVRTPKTSAQAIVDTLAFSKRIGKTPVVVGNCTGFAVNRVFFPYTMAACLLVDLGIDPYRIDKVISSQFGMPMGPFRLSDLVGGDVGVHVGANIVASYPDRVYPATLIPSLVAAKRLGEKSGAGFYVYDAKRKAAPDPQGLAPFLAASRAKNNMPKPSAMNDADIIEFIFYPVVNEAARVVAERIVDKASDLDVAAVLGMGFPPFRGGLVHWADEVGAARIAARLAQWAPLYGPLFAPCEFLARTAAKGGRLSDGPGGGGPVSKL